jgi:excisionase family DNA binding protein
MGRRKPGPNDSTTAPLDASRLYAAGDAARLLGLSPSGFRDLARSGRLTCERTAGNQRRVSGAELLRFLEARAEDPAPARDRPSAPAPSAAERAARQAWLAHHISQGLTALPAEAPPTARLRLRADIERALRAHEPGALEADVDDLVRTVADRAREQVEAEQERAALAENKAALIEDGLATLVRLLGRLPARLVGPPGSPARRHLHARLRDQVREVLEARLTGVELIDDVDELVRDVVAAWQNEHTPPSRVPKTVREIAKGLVWAAGGAAAVTLSVPDIRADVKQRAESIKADLAQRLRTVLSTIPSPPASPATGPETERR